MSSNFTLEECQRYAARLHATGQGINNPGGYATSIYRSGEADALIEKFLTPPASKPETPDTGQCPDCRGTGFWYPRGVSHGVTKCRHENLQNLSRQSSDGHPSGQRLTAEQIAEQTELITDLLDNGYTLEQAKSQFASGMHPEDWQIIQATAISRSGRNQNQVGSRNAARAHP